MGANEIQAQAQILFAKYGYENTSLSFIAEESGVKKQTIYSHFKSKEDLFRAVAESVSAQECQYLSRFFAKDEPPFALLQSFVLAMQKRLTDAEDTSARLIIRMIFEPSGVLAEQSPSQCPEYLHQLEHSLVSALIRQGIQPPRARNLAALTGTFLIGLFGILVFVGQKPFENKYLASLPVLEQLLKG